jgi:hypothetical protein
LSTIWPTPAETASLRFVFPMASLQTRVAAAFLLFAAGLAVWCLAPTIVAALGLLLIAAGHLPLWVRTQTNAPGGATPRHEEVWAPAEDDWLDRVRAHERRGAKWDTTPWDVSNLLGAGALVLLLVALFVVAGTVGAALGADAFFRVGVAAPLLLVPLWINGMRTTWNPSELRKKGEALAVARAEAERLSAGDFEPVPLLALREGRRGRYPVDARLMLRPAREDETGFLGVQLQVAMNSVQGTDYPYLYAVVLGKDAFRPPGVEGERTAHGVRLVLELGRSEGVRFLVVRQHADTKGGWHTEPEHIRGIVETALELARTAWREAGGKVSG